MNIPIVPQVFPFPKEMNNESHTSIDDYNGFVIDGTFYSFDSEQNLTGKI